MKCGPKKGRDLKMSKDNSCPHLSCIVLNGFQHTMKSSISYKLPLHFSLFLGGAPPDFT